MAISLNPEVQRRIEERMKRGRFPTTDALLLHALDTLDQMDAAPLEELDAETQAAIEEGLAQADRGEGRPWAEVREQLRSRFLNK